ncbi:MAG TPA: amidase family protein [Albidovulum sp.]|uniref:amidase n=1 Tax=Albidovulum sp. TaxID=1872424 RepID=UPI002CF8DE65|nr:amidase family protein [Albidovulum sp.]
MEDLTAASAIEVTGLLRKGDVRPGELLDQIEARMNRVEPLLNALVSPCFDRARQHARQIESLPVAERGLLAGLPVSIKDLTAVAGVRTTWGSTLYGDHVPAASDSLVTHLEAEGGVVYAKSNSPEMGVGGNTFNDVFGPTRNPWNLARTAGGSSGGAAASLAAHTSWLSTGSDSGGSLRTPAAFCGVVGLRPTPFRVPNSPSGNPFDLIAVDGPMARDVRDVALFLDAMAWADPAVPFAAPLPAAGYLAAAERPKERAAIAFSPDLGLGCINPDIAGPVTAAVEKLARSGFDVRPTDLSLKSMDRAYHTFRALEFAASFGDLGAAERKHFKPELNWNIDRGLALSGSDIIAATRERAAAFDRLLALLDEVDVLVCPATSVAAFPVEERYHGAARQIGDEHYLDWLSIAYVLTALAVPVLVIPCGLTDEGLPVGIQIIGRPNGEAALLSVGAALESALRPWAKGANPSMALLDRQLCLG